MNDTMTIPQLIPAFYENEHRLKNTEFSADIAERYISQRHLLTSICDGFELLSFLTPVFWEGDRLVSIESVLTGDELVNALLYLTDDLNMELIALAYKEGFSTAMPFEERIDHYQLFTRS